MKTTRSVTRAFSSGHAAASLSAFIVNSCVAKGSAGTPLSFTGRDKALAKPHIFPPIYPTN